MKTKIKLLLVFMLIINASIYINCKSKKLENPSIPIISPGSGTIRVYRKEQSVSISIATTGATIKYTLDNSDPKTSATAITGNSGASNVKFKVFGTKTIKAYAFKHGEEDSAVVSCEYVIARISIPKTGQSICFDANEDITSCSKTKGQDGNYQTGTVWPNPRFTNNGDGTITDNLTGLMWQQNGSYSTTWTEAITYCENLDLGGYMDWRLPNRNELKSLINFGQSNPTTWLNTQGFIDIQFNYYWSASTYAGGANCAWSMYMLYGYFHRPLKDRNCHVLAVRSGN